MTTRVMVFVLIAFSAAAQFGDDSRLLGRYLFAGGQVGNVAVDGTSRTNEAVATGWVFTATSATNVFATTNIIQTKLTGTLATNDSVAVSLWFRTSSVSNMALCGVNMGSPGSVVFDLELGSIGSAYVSFRDTDSTVTDTVSITNELRNGAWQHLCGMYDGDARQIRLYFNGVASSNATVTANSGSTAKTWTNGIGIGALRATAPIRPFIGQLHDVRFLRYAPTQAEVRFLMAESAP